MPPPSRFNPTPTAPYNPSPYTLPPSRFNPAPTPQTSVSGAGAGRGDDAAAAQLAPGGPAAPAAPAAPGAAPAAPRPGTAPPAARYLSPEEQRAIVASLSRPGWTIVGGAAVPETKLGTDIRGQSVNVPTGAYTIQVTDGSGNIQPVTIYPGNPIAQPDGSSTPTWIPSNTPDTLPKPTTTAASNTVDMADGSRWEAQGKNPDGTTKWVQIGAPKASNPDADRSLALKAQQDQETIDRRRANEAAGRGYLTDQEWIQAQLDGERNNLTGQQIAATRERQAQLAKIEDAKLQDEINEIKARTGQIGAQTTLANAQANQVISNVDIAGRKAPGEIEETASRTDLAKAQAAQARQATTIAAQPTVISPGTGQAIYTQNPLTGELKASVNQNFQPKTQADVAARMGQLQVMAQQKKQELLQRSQNDPNFTADRATSEWNSWWDQNVEGQKQSLQAAQAQAAAEEERQQAATRTAAYTAANAAGTQAISAYNAQAPRIAAPGFGAMADRLMGGGQLKPGDASAFIVHGVPDLQQQAHDATMEALKYISPTAAQATGQPQPNYAGVDIAGGLNRVNYGFGGPTPAAPAPAGAGVATAAPAQQPTDDWFAQLMRRQAASNAEQQVQAQIPMPPPAPVNAVPGQNYGANVAYTGGVAPWNFDPNDPYGNSRYGFGGA